MWALEALTVVICDAVMTMSTFFILCTFTERMYPNDQHSTQLNEVEQEPFVHVFIGAYSDFLRTAAILGA